MMYDIIYIYVIYGTLTIIYYISYIYIFNIYIYIYYIYIYTSIFVDPFVYISLVINHGRCEIALH